MAKETIKLNISGMTCVNCSNGIEKAVNKLDGLESSKVSFASNEGEFSIDNKTTGFGGTGQSFDWNLLKDIKTPYFLSGGLSLEKIKEIVLYFEPFVAYIPEHHASFQKEEIEVSDLNLNEILLLQDGHCFRNGILNLCKNNKYIADSHFQIESGSFETLIKLADEGLGTTLLPYLHTLDLNDKNKTKLTIGPVII